MLNEPKCYTRKCRHFKGAKQDGLSEIGERPYCTAYPDGIPNDIAYGKNKHLRVRDDQDNNIVYEKA